jgi:hypothetical protein
MNETVQDLQAARDILVDHWCPTGLQDTQGNVCIVGALNKVIFGEAHFGVRTAEEELLERRARSMNALREHLPNPRSQLSSWNDHKSTEHQDVLNLFDKALADLGGL